MGWTNSSTGMKPLSVSYQEWTSLFSNKKAVSFQEKEFSQMQSRVKITSLESSDTSLSMIPVVILLTYHHSWILQSWRQIFKASWTDLGRMPRWHPCRTICEVAGKRNGSITHGEGLEVRCVYAFNANLSSSRGAFSQELKQIDSW